MFGKKIVTYEQQLAEAREVSRQMLTEKDWKRKTPLLIEKYLTLHYAEDPRFIYGGLFFDSDEILLSAEVLAVDGVWTTIDLVAAGAIHGATSVIVFSVNRHGNSSDRTSVRNRMRVDETKAALALIEIELNGWLIVSGTVILAVNV